MKKAIELLPSQMVYQDLTGSYSSSVTLKGSYIKSGSDSYGPTLGPKPILTFRPAEQSTSIPGNMMCVVPWTDRYHWLFYADGAAAAVTRRIGMYTVDLQDWTIDWNGFITMNHSAIAGAKTIRGLRAVVYNYTTGSVAVSASLVSGVSTEFSTQRISTGSRIGFGSTNASEIGTWYDTALISSNTNLTIAGDAGLIPSGTSYIIEELNLITANTNATVANGGLFVVKGLNPTAFSSIGTTINEATADLQRGIYYLTTSASNVPNTNVAAGLGLFESTSYSNHQCYVVDGTTTARVFSFNLRAPLTVTAAKSTGSFQWATAASATLTGTTTQVQNPRLAVTAHGPGSGSNDLYFATTTRLYRMPSASIYSGSAVHISAGDNVVENPPGGTTVAQLTSLMASIEYSDLLDTFVIPTTYRTYITQYKTDGSQFDNFIGCNTVSTDQSSSPSDSVPHINNSNNTFTVWVQDGILYMLRVTATTTLNQGYMVPLRCDHTFAELTNDYVITQAIDTSDATKLYRVYINKPQSLGSKIYGVNPEPIFIDYRTSGISDNSGGWTALPPDGDLTGVSPGAQIQFRMKFKVSGLTGVPSNFYGLTVVYEDESSVTNFIPSVSKSSSTNRIFAWRMEEAFVGSIPNLTITLKNADTDSVVLSDTTAVQGSGTFEYSVDGNTWSTWNATSANVVNQYIRYTATTLPDNISIFAALTLA